MAIMSISVSNSLSSIVQSFYDEDTLPQRMNFILPGFNGENKVTTGQLTRIYESLYPNNNPSKYGALRHPTKQDQFIQANRIYPSTPDDRLMEMSTELKYELIDLKEDEKVMPLPPSDKTVIYGFVHPQHTKYGIIYVPITGGPLQLMDDIPMWAIKQRFYMFLRDVVRIEYPAIYNHKDYELYHNDAKVDDIDISKTMLTVKRYDKLVFREVGFHGGKNEQQDAVRGEESNGGIMVAFVIIIILLVCIGVICWRHDFCIKAKDNDVIDRDSKGRIKNICEKCQGHGILMPNPPKQPCICSQCNGNGVATDKRMTNV